MTSSSGSTNSLQTLVLFLVAFGSMAALIHPRCPSKGVAPALDVDGGEGQQNEGGGGIPEAAADDSGHYEEENGEYFEGDLNIRQELIDAYYGKLPALQSLTTSGLWPNSRYHYICDNSMDAAAKMIIQQAIAVWQQGLQACVQFVEGMSNTGYVRFTSGRTGCYSTAIGYQGSVEHVVNLQHPSCTNLHTVLHEIGHTLGYWHEQSRPDRDSYVRINYANVARAYRSQLSRQAPWGVSTNDMGYDYGSIMHYSETAFSVGGITIKVINMTEYLRQGSPVLGGRTSLSATDIAAMKRHYDCQ